MKKVLLGIVFFFLIIFALFMLRQSDLSVFVKEAIKNCDSNPDPQFTHFPTDFDAITSISSPIMKLPSGVKGHSYINVNKRVPIYAPADSLLVEGSKYREDFRPGVDQYLLHFDVSCEVFYFYDHVIEPSEKIANLFSDSPATDTRTRSVGPVEIEAGEFLGYSPGTKEHNFDFGVVNESQTTILADNPEYPKSAKYEHADCPYDYYGDDMREALFALLEYQNWSDLEVIDNIWAD